MSPLLFLRSAAIAAAIVAGALPLAAQSTPAITWEPVTIRAFDGRTTEAEAGRIEVPERRGVAGRAISLGFVRLPHTGATAGDPILFLMGGPGVPGSVIGQVPPYFTLFQRLRELGDVVLIDQRGLGRSAPTLECPADGPLATDVFATRAGLVTELTRRTAACAAQWRARGTDPTAYTTIASADDVDDLRKALGVPRVHLLAFSYGTRLALATVQRHGAHVGRIVLAGVNGPGHVLKMSAAVDRKLDRISAQLATDSAWRGAPTLVAAAHTARTRLARQPATVTITDRRTGQPVRLTIGEEGFLAIVSLHLDDARLPALVLSVATNDDDVLALMADADWNGLGGSATGLMARAVNCAADRPPQRVAAIRRAAGDAALGEPIDNALLSDEFCGTIGYATPAVEFEAPVRSAVPALLVTGTLDATTPQENADAVARGLPNAVLLTVTNGAHETLPIDSVQDAVVRFLRGQDVRALHPATVLPRYTGIDQAKRAADPPR